MEEGNGTGGKAEEGRQTTSATDDADVRPDDAIKTILTSIKLRLGLTSYVYHTTTIYHPLSLLQLR